MKSMKAMPSLSTLTSLASVIGNVNEYFLNKVQKQVNTALTLRNWVVGFYISEYELKGKDRAVYGTGLLKAIAMALKQKGVNSLQERNLYLCREFFTAYPDILQTLSAESYMVDFSEGNILQTVSAKSKKVNKPSAYLNELLTNLSFSHFIELLKADAGPKRHFYEIQAIKNNWGVRDLKRAIDGLLYERTGMSINKKAVFADQTLLTKLKPENLFRNTYLLEFLGLESKGVFTESDLEERIISHLQNFLLELGRGFCFEQRQKRITFGNTHYRIDLVFYHRILKCHVLLDLKIGEFDHADAGQMNMYLNYFKENETEKGDNNPVGIILCSGKNEALVKYATMGLPQKIFVSKYMINLPTEKELKNILEAEQDT